MRRGRTSPLQISVTPRCWDFRGGGGVSAFPNTSPGILIPTHHPSTTSFHQWVKPREGHGATERNESSAWAHFHVRALIPRSFSEVWDNLQQTVTSPFCARDIVFVAKVVCPSYLSHPPVLGASCPASSVPRWVSGLTGSGDTGGGYKSAASACENPSWCIDVSVRNEVKTDQLLDRV